MLSLVPTFLLIEDKVACAASSQTYATVHELTQGPCNDGDLTAPGACTNYEQKR